MGEVIITESLKDCSLGVISRFQQWPLGTECRSWWFLVANL